jgi:RHS repeat-associated protein
VGQGGYRYGFNGKEKDDDVNGTGVTYDYGFRIYDARIARFLSVDPLTKEYPWYTPYQFAGNKPIFAIDLDGLEELPAFFNIFFGLLKPRGPAQIVQHQAIVFTVENNEIIRDAIGFVPVVGEVVDGFSGAVYTYNGDYLNAAFSFISLAPIAEDVTAKSVKYALKYADEVGGLSKASSRQFNSLDAAVKWVKDAQRFGIDKADRIKKAASRPGFRKGFVEKVWESSKDANGKVFDPNTLEELTWDKFKSRFDQWHMGHKPDKEWRRLKQEYIDGNKTWEEVTDEYNNIDNYLPESPKSNMSGEFESKKPVIK